MATFLYDENLGELIKELRNSLSTGRMKYDDALDVLKKAIKELVKNKAIEYNDKERN